MRAGLVERSGANPRPIVMGDDVAERNVMLLHEEGGQFGGALHGLGDAVAIVFTHFNSDGVIVSLAIKVGMFALFSGGNVLDGNVILHGEMPSKETNAVSAGPLMGPQCSSVQGPGVGVGITRFVFRGVNRDIRWIHGTIKSSPIFTGGNQIPSHIGFTQKLGRRDLVSARIAAADLRTGGAG